MKIAHLLSSFEIGGQERMVRDLAVGQQLSGHQALAISLAPPPDGPLADELRARGVETARVAKRGRHFDPTLPFRLAALLRRAGVDVVHAHNHQPLVYGAPAAKLARATAVYTRHGQRAGGWRLRLARRAAARWLDASVAVSADTASIARRLGEGTAGRVAVVENGIDTSPYRRNAETRAEVRRALGIPGQAWVIGSVGRLVPEKSYDLLLRAAAPLLGEAAHLVLAGEGSEGPALRALRSTLPAGRFIHLPGLRRDVPALLAALDVFALCSRSEGLPLALLEAMASGLPVVATAVGGIGAVLDDSGAGLLIPPGDEAALRSALDRLTRDPARAAEMGRRARQLALARYDRARMVDGYFEIYRRAGAPA
jgi:glycosyltransferase involved in cell wall biosynthesis